ncbi:MAG: hypothetical protein GY699_03405, partial [Desulfobacteraceae bacterium]|nr:hypothetical protein [Desulfobacteraceae bacterium]
MKSNKNMTAMRNPGATKILAMDLPTEELNFYGVFQGLKPADRNRLYPFLSNLDLSMIDYFTLNDLCQRGDCRGDAAFIFVLAHLLYAVKQGSLCIDIKADNTFKTGGDPKTTGIFTKAFLDNYTSGQY